MRKILCTGSRDWTDTVTVAQALEVELRRSNPSKPDIVIHGNCRGLDKIVEKVCQLTGIHTAVVDARWLVHGERAGPLRNGVMVSLEPDVALVFHDDLPNSKGTKDCVLQLIAACVDVKYFRSQPK